MKLTEDPSIGLVDCPFCSSPAGIPCVVDPQRRVSPFPADREYHRSHAGRLRMALYKLHKERWSNDDADEMCSVLEAELAKRKTKGRK